MANAIATTSENFGDRLKAWPERTKSFYNDVRSEMRKVTAPSWKEVQATTAVVVVTVFIFGVYFFIIDNAIQSGVTFLYSYFGTSLDGPFTRETSRAEFNLIMQDEEKNEAAAGGEQASGADGVAATSEAPRNPNMKWYIIHSYSGFERKVKESLESRVRLLVCKIRSAKC